MIKKYIKRFFMSLEVVLNKVKKRTNVSWHQTRSYNYTTVCGMNTGCGLAQIHGVVNLCLLNPIEAREILKKIADDYRNDGAGAILATLGDSYYARYEQKLLNLGFKFLREYNNYRHGLGATQRLYIL